MTKIVGHRGARGLAPENTLASIQKALEAGVDEIEIDVRVTKDNVPVLVHDSFLRDRQGRRLVIAERTYRQLQRVRLTLTTLEEAILLVNRQVPLLIEVKPKVAVQPVVAVLQDFLDEGWRASEFLLGSKSQATLQALHKALPRVAKVVIERFSGVRAVHRARQVGTKRLNMNQHFVWFGFVRAMHRRGYQLYPYTVNNPHKAQRWSKRGLAGVITDYPDRLKNSMK